MTVPYKKNKSLLLENKNPLTYTMKLKSTLRNITSLDMMQECELIDEFPDDTSPVVMEYCANEEHKDSIRNDLIEEIDRKIND